MWIISIDRCLGVFVLLYNMEENFSVTGNIDNKGNNRRFISIDDTIARAKERGVDFGNGKARNRLRYYAKNNLIPPAERKSFNGDMPTGAYPEDVVDILVEIDQELKKGKTIQAIIQERQKKEISKEISQKESAKGAIPLYQKMAEEELRGPKKQKVEEPVLVEFSEPKRAPFSFKTAGLILFLIVLSSLLLFGLSTKGYFSKLVASVSDLFLAQVGVEQSQETGLGLDPLSLQQNSIISQLAEPYLNINVETDINAPLNLKGETPMVSFFKDGFYGTLNVPSLSADRSYTLPDSSGVVCLSSGNCIGLAGEVTTAGGTANRLAKFLSPNRIGASSISDFYTRGVAITINELGNIGIGTTEPQVKFEVAGPVRFSQAGDGSPFQVDTNDESAVYVDSEGNVGLGKTEPKYDLDVEGRIQASGDICTDLKGGVCLSKVQGSSIMVVGGGGGIDGSGSGNYLSKWSDADTLANSVIYQSGSNIGVGTTNANEKLTIGGVISLAESTEPSTTTDYGKLYVTTSGKLYFKDENGSLYDLTSPGVAGSGAVGEVGFFTATTTIAGNSAFYWDSANKRLGIGTSSPDATLHVVGTSSLGIIASGTWQGTAINSRYGGLGKNFSTSTGILQLTSGTFSTTTFTAGSILFASSSGLITEDNANFYWDSANKRLGIGTSTPNYALDIVGGLGVSGTTTLNGLSYRWPSSYGSSGYVLSNSSGTLSWIPAAGGVSGSGATGTVAFWTSSTDLSNDSNFYWNSSTHRLGIATTNPAYALDVAGTGQFTNLKTAGFQLTTGATSGYALISDASGVGTWQSLPAGNLPIGAAGQTLRHNGSNWIANSFLYNNGSAIGIGTSSPNSVLSVAGDMNLAGPLTLSTTSLPQFVLRYDGNNYFNISTNATRTEITASKTLTIDSLTGEIRMGSNVTLLNATGSEVRGASFVSASNDATVRASGEYILRASVPVFAHPMPVQTTATSYTRISKVFSTSSSVASSTPAVLPGATRKYAFLINYADDIAADQTSDWRVYRPSAASSSQTFTFPGQDMSSLEEGNPVISDYFSLPDNDWQLEIKVPAGDTIRIFNIFLLAYDQVN